MSVHILKIGEKVKEENKKKYYHVSCPLCESEFICNSSDTDRVNLYADHNHALILSPLFDPGKPIKRRVKCPVCTYRIPEDKFTEISKMVYDDLAQKYDQ